VSETLAYLQAKGLPLKSAGTSNVNTPCVFCSEDPQKRGRLYVNVSGGDEDGLYFCHLCGTKGNLRTMRRHFGDPVESEDQDTSYLRHTILAAAASYYHERITTDVVDWLVSERGLEHATIQKHQLGWADGHLLKYLREEHSLPLKEILETGLVVERNGRYYDFLHDQVTLPYHVAGNVVLIRGKQIGGKYQTPPGQKTRLFNSDATWGADELLVAEGEFDALVLEQLGYKAVACPGANVWQDSWTGYFIDTKRVYLLFDNDVPGQEGAKKVRDHIGHRSKIVEIPDEGLPPGENDVTNWVVNLGATAHDIDLLLNEAVMQGSLLVNVDQAFAEWLQLQGAEGIRFGFEKLDAAIQPGLLPGQVCVVLAKTNTGKTMFLLNMFQRMSKEHPDAKILFLSLEQTRGDWFERARRLWNFYNVDCPDDEVAEQSLNYWRDRLLIVDRNRVSEEQLLGCIDEFEIQMGEPPTVIAIDYLGYWASGFKASSRYERVTDAIMSLKAVAKERRVPIITPHQVSRMAEFGMELSIDQARDSGAVEETADLVLALWAPDTAAGRDPSEFENRIVMKIGKSRHGGKGTLINLKFAPLTLTIVQEEERLAKWAAREGQYLKRAQSWQQAIANHRTGRDLGVPQPAVGDLDF
jgi:archaellum biogenesis ATPase FlaH